MKEKLGEAAVGPELSDDVKNQAVEQLKPRKHCWRSHSIINHINHYTVNNVKGQKSTEQWMKEKNDEATKT